MPGSGSALTAAQHRPESSQEVSTPGGRGDTLMGRRSLHPALQLGDCRLQLAGGVWARTVMHSTIDDAEESAGQALSLLRSHAELRGKRLNEVHGPPLKFRKAALRRATVLREVKTSRRRWPAVSHDSVVETREPLCHGKNVFTGPGGDLRVAVDACTVECPLEYGPNSLDSLEVIALRLRLRLGCFLINIRKRRLGM